MAKTVELATQIDNWKDLDLYSVYNLIKFIFDTGATVHTVTDKSLFITYNTTDKYVSWGKVRTLRIQGEGSCKITFPDTNITVLLRNCYHIPELGINIIGGSALPLDVYWIGNNNTLAITKNNKFITKATMKNGLYYLLASIPHMPIHNINSTMEILHKRFAYINPDNLKNIL